MTMTKADIVERIYEKVGFSKKEATEIVESLFEVVKRRLEAGEKVKVSGFGNFVVNEKRPRKGRNPKTGDKVDVPPKKVPYFKPGKELKELINKEVAPAPAAPSGSSPQAPPAPPDVLGV